MLEDALAGGDDAEIAAVVKYLRRASPEDNAQIDSIIADSKARAAAAKEEKMRAAGFFDNWSGEGQIGGFKSTGNADTTGLSAGIALEKEGLRWRHNVRALVDYQRSNGVTNRNQILVAYEPNYKINDRLFAFGLAQYERDRFQGFSRRTTLGGGLGYRVIVPEPMTLDVKVGPAWRSTNYIVGPSVNRLSGLVSADYAWKISPTITFTELATALIDSDNRTLSSLTALDAKIAGDLSARVSFQIDNQSSPPPGIKNTATLTRFTVVYGF